MFTQSHLNIWGLGEFLEVMQTLDKVEGFHNCLEFSEPTSFIDVTMEKVLFSFKLNALVCVVFWFAGYMFLPILKIILILVILSLFDIYMWTCLLSKFSCKVEIFFINLEKQNGTHCAIAMATVLSLVLC